MVHVLISSLAPQPVELGSILHLHVSPTRAAPWLTLKSETGTWQPRLCAERGMPFFLFSDIYDLNMLVLYYLANTFLIVNCFAWYCSLKFSLNDTHACTILLLFFLRSLPAFRSATSKDCVQYKVNSLTSGLHIIFTALELFSSVLP